MPRHGELIQMGASAVGLIALAFCFLLLAFSL
jgi:hypothetical protein